MYLLPKDNEKIEPNIFNDKCPARHILGKVSGKWSLLIIDALNDNKLRNGELMRIIQGVSQKVLTQKLRELEDLQLVKRFDRQTIPPHVEYQLTPMGISLREKVCAIDRWIEDNMLSLIENDSSIQLAYT